MRTFIDSSFCNTPLRRVEPTPRVYPLSKKGHKNIEHLSTVVVCRNRPELLYVLTWAGEEGKDTPYFMYDVSQFPYCLSLCGDTVGWTDIMDRDLYYKSFREFLGDITALGY